MTPTELVAQLQELAADPDNFSFDARRVTTSLEAAGAGREHLHVILTFMEQHPDLDLGTPGPLVHFVEKVFLGAYEPDLVASIRRRPTLHTLWLANRIANSRDREGRVSTIELFCEVEASSELDVDVRDEAKRYRERLELLG